MRKRLIIKSFKVKAKSKDSISKLIVVGSNKSKVNGYYIEKLGVYTKHKDEFFYCLKLDRVAYWVNRGAIIKPRISWVIGMIGKGFSKDANK